jgi:hypothetical protein
MSNYFHVVTQDLNKSEQVLFRDLSKKELKKHFLKPFKNGRNLFINGTIYKNAEIKKVQIIKTEVHFQKTLDIYEDQQNNSRNKLNNEQYGSGVVFVGPYFSQDIDIIDCGENVTTEFLKLPPSNQPSFLASIFKNPWFIRIVGGIILAVILWAISHYSGLAL